MRTELEKTFRHRAWFIGGQKTRAEALDYFAQSGDFYTIAKRFYSMTGSKRNPANLYPEIFRQRARKL